MVTLFIQIQPEIMQIHIKQVLEKRERQRQRQRQTDRQRQRQRQRQREETTKGLQHRCTQLRQPRKDLSAKIFTEITLLNQNNSLNLPLHTNITSLAIFLNLYYWYPWNC